MCNSIILDNRDRKFETIGLTMIKLIQKNFFSETAGQRPRIYIHLLGFEIFSSKLFIYSFGAWEARHDNYRSMLSNS